jgi:5-methylcytosine-specific restriction enzyme A
MSRRPDFRERGYKSTWDATARDFKQRYPLCLGCWAVGLETPVEIVDHVVPLVADRTGLLDTSNMQPACRWHHDNVKRTLELQWRLGQVPTSALRLDSTYAIALTRQRYAVPIGVDGYPLFELAPTKRPYPER